MRRDWRKFDVDGVEFDLPPRFAPPLRRCGDGSYGLVCSCFDTTRHEFVAVKKITGIFRDKTLKRPMCAIREVEILRHNKEFCAALGSTSSPLLLPLLDVYCPPQSTMETLADIYVVTPLLAKDLHSLLSGKRRLQSEVGRPRTSPLTFDRARDICRQLLTSLSFLHSSGIIHGDVKPANMLLSNCDGPRITCCLADFGLSQPVPDSPNQRPYRTVVTNYYRPPELFLGNHMYGTEIDIWSAGCVIAEMFVGRPLFPFREECYADQLKMIAEYVGAPPVTSLTAPLAPKCLLTLPRKTKSVAHLLPKECCTVLQDTDNYYTLLVDFVEQMLEVDPFRRPSAAQMLLHPFLHYQGDSKTTTSSTINKDKVSPLREVPTNLPMPPRYALKKKKCNFSDIADLRAARELLWMLVEPTSRGDGG